MTLNFRRIAVVTIVAAAFTAAILPGSAQNVRPNTQIQAMPVINVAASPAQLLAAINALKQQVATLQSDMAALKQQNQDMAKQLASTKMDVGAVKFTIVGLDNSLKMTNQNISAFKTEYQGHHHEVGQSQGLYTSAQVGQLSVHIDGQGYAPLTNPWNPALRLMLFTKGAEPIKTGGPQ